MCARCCLCLLPFSRLRWQGKPSPASLPAGMMAAAFPQYRLPAETLFLLVIQHYKKGGRCCVRPSGYASSLFRSCTRSERKSVVAEKRYTYSSGLLRISSMFFSGVPSAKRLANIFASTIDFLARICASATMLSYSCGLSIRILSSLVIVLPSMPFVLHFSSAVHSIALIKCNYKGKTEKTY